MCCYDKEQCGTLQRILGPGIVLVDIPEDVVF